MKVEILKLTDTVATCRISEGGRVIDFSCGLGDPAHELLRHIIRHAMRELAEAEINDKLRAFSK